MKLLLELVRGHKMQSVAEVAAPAVNRGIYSVCSAHPIVIEAALRQGLVDEEVILIEATSNQVNQFGGYTGMTPVAFKAFVLGIADRVKFPAERILFGGDHLGPNCWQSEAAASAMCKSETLIRDYVSAGFRKIHLDCSMSCADDPVPLTDAIVAQRAARLCAIAEHAWAQVGGDQPVYVIGTEVPVPGGAHEELAELQVTSATAAATTIRMHQQAFHDAGLEQVWPRVIGLVVQPGVEFDHHKVIDYQSDKATTLSAYIKTQPTLVYEAHSTDYQTAPNLRSLVQDHFAILKVGPGLTFALRETLWALAEIEAAMLGAESASQHSANRTSLRTSNFKQIVLQTMQVEPGYWDKYYCDPSTHKFDMQFSLSDRIRYYWSHPDIVRAQAVLLNNLAQRAIPLTLLSQYCPIQYQAIRLGQMVNHPTEILIDGVAEVLRHYQQACNPAGITNESKTSWSTV